MKYISKYFSPLGGIVIISDGEALTGLYFENEKLPENRYEERELAVFDETRRWLDIYFGGGIPDFVPAIKLSGSDFQLAVWELLRDIPYGKTTTYGELAAIIAQKKGIAKMSAQAVGGAVGKNPVSIIIPCHRVVGKKRRTRGVRRWD